MRSSTPSRARAGTPSRVAPVAHYQVPTPVRSRNGHSCMTRQPSCHALQEPAGGWVEDRRASLAIYPGDMVCPEGLRCASQAPAPCALAGQMRRAPSQGQLSGTNSLVPPRRGEAVPVDRAGGGSVGLPRSSADVIFAAAASPAAGPAAQQAAVARARTPTRAPVRGQHQTAHRHMSPARRTLHTPRAVPVEVECLSAPVAPMATAVTVKVHPSSLTLPRQRSATPPRSVTPPRHLNATPLTPPRHRTPPRRPAESMVTEVKQSNETLREWCLGSSQPVPRVRTASMVRESSLSTREREQVGAQASQEVGAQASQEEEGTRSMPVRRQDSVISLGMEDPDRPLYDNGAICVEQVSLSPRRDHRQTAASKEQPRVGAGREDTAVANSDATPTQGLPEATESIQRDSFGGSWGVLKGLWHWEQSADPGQTQVDASPQAIPAPADTNERAEEALESVCDRTMTPPAPIAPTGPMRAPTRSRAAVPPQVKQNSEALREWCLGLSRVEPRPRTSSLARESSSSGRAEEEEIRPAPVQRQDSVISLGAEDPARPHSDAAPICVEKVSLSPRQDHRQVAVQQSMDAPEAATGHENIVEVPAEAVIILEGEPDEVDCHPAGSFGGSWGAQAHFGNGNMSPEEPQPEVPEDPASDPGGQSDAVEQDDQEAAEVGKCMTPVASLIGSMQIQPELWLPPFSIALSGANLELSEDGYTATRWRGSRQSVTVTSAPLTRHKHGLFFEVEVRETVDGWVGGLGIGVTHTKPQTLHRLPDKAWRIPKSFIVGYAGCAYLDGQEHPIPWRADALRTGDTIGLLITGDGRGDLLLFVNSMHVFTLQGSVLERAGLRTEPLYPVLDVFAATKSVTLLPSAEPPALPPPWQRATEGGSTAVPSTYDASSRVSRACDDAGVPN